MSWRSSLIAGAGAAATAAAGGLATDVESSWYRGLHKPPFQPPGPAFGIVWSVVYTCIGAGAGRTLGRLPAGARRGFAVAYGVNLVLNAGWTWIFFRARRPDLAALEILALQASNLDLLRRARPASRAGAALLLPYVAWTAFATVLSADIARRNR